MFPLDTSRKWLARSAWGLTLVYASVAFLARPSFGLTLFGDSAQFLLAAVLTMSFACNIPGSFGRARWFWALMSSGALLWLSSQVIWSYHELVRGDAAPVAYFGNVLLFLHLVPMMAALAAVPHERKPMPPLIALSLATLAGWWIFLYTFLVIPWQYVQPSHARYGPAFTALYAIEDVIFIGALAVLAIDSRGRWRRLYLCLLAGSLVYTIDSHIIDSFIQQKSYYTGSRYDLLFIVPVAWMAYVAADFGNERQSRKEETSEAAVGSNWTIWLSMSALFSVPLLLAWNVFSGASGAVRDFRSLVAVATILMLSAILFAKQHILGRQLSQSLASAESSLAQLAETREELEYRATHDAMTGILNRATVILALGRELARAKREQTQVAVLLADLDHFKHINDSFGHHAGDVALGFVSARMQQCIRPHDYLGRYGGEEFLIVISDCTQATAIEIAERVRCTIGANAASFDAHPLMVTTTIGVALSEPNEDPQTILRRADQALYQGKQRGRNVVQVAESTDSNDRSAGRRV